MTAMVRGTPGARQGRAAPLQFLKVLEGSQTGNGTGVLAGLWLPTLNDPDDAASAVNWAIAQAARRGGTVVIPQSIIINESIVRAQGVTIQGWRQSFSAAFESGVTVTAGPGLTSGWMFDCPANVVGSAVVGLNILGNSAGSSNVLGGVHVPTGSRYHVLCYLTIGGVSDSAIGFEGQPVGCVVDRNIMEYNVTGRTLTGPRGVLHITGTDHIIGYNEVDGGPAWAGGPANGYDRVSYPGQYYRCGLYINGSYIDVGKVVPEFCDTGLYIDSAALLIRFAGGARSDYSAGPGVYNLGSDSDFIGFQVNGCGFANPYDGLLYDAVVHAGSAQRNKWTNFGYNIAGAAFACRYGWSDTVTGNGTQQENLLESHTIRPEYVFYDTVSRAEPRTSIKRGGSGPITDRPPSRWANGQTWWDSTRNIATFSDGAAWRDAFGGISGNLCTPKLAEGIGGTLQIQNGDTTCTVTGGLWVNLGGTSAQLLPFGAIAGATCTAAGATAGYMTVATVADTLGHFTAVIAGEDYTYGVRSAAKTIAAAISLIVNYFDSGNAYLGSSAITAATGGGTNSTSAVTDTYWQHVTAPVGAAFAQPVFRFTRAGMAAGEAHFLNGVTIIPDSAGLVTGYVRP